MPSGQTHRIAVPTPFLVGDVNAYLLLGDPLTLVDTGPNLASSLRELETALSRHRVTVEDIELIVLTHQHNDHTGLTSVIQARSGAQIAAFAPLGPWMASFPRSAAQDDEYARELMAAHGVPEELNSALSVTAHLTRAFGSAASVGVPLADGASLTAGSRRWRVMHRPGHSPSDLIFFDEQNGEVLGGDHLMSSVASNAILTRPLTDPLVPRPRPLLDYRDSLRRTAELPNGIVIRPGHGPRVSGHRELIAERLRIHERRARKIHRTLGKQPMSAHRIALAMWGRMAITQAPLMMSEVLGHLDLLLQNGTAVEDHDDGHVRFRAV